MFLKIVFVISSSVLFLCIYIPHSEHLGFYDCFLCERSKGMRISLSKPKQRNLGKNGLVENIQQGDEQRDAHKPDDGCSDWMLCSVICKGILAVTTVNLLSQFFNMFKNRGTSKQRTYVTIDLRLIQIISNI